VKQAESRPAELNPVGNHASRVQSNFLSLDAQALAADVHDRNTARTTKPAEQAKPFPGLSMPSGPRAEIHVVGTLLGALQLGGLAGLTLPQPSHKLKRFSRVPSRLLWQTAFM
jgi:hypothetical protein